MTPVTKEMTIFEVLQRDESVAPVFYGFGMHCLGCPISRGENLEQAAEAHGIDLNEFLQAINDHFLKSGK